MTNDKEYMNITENYFKTIKWKLEQSILGEYWDYPYMPPLTVGNALHKNELPNITQYFPDFKKWVLEKMEKEGFEPFIEMGDFSWSHWNTVHKNIKVGWNRHEPIKNNEILEAAVITATRYFEKKK